MPPLYAAALFLAYLLLTFLHRRPPLLGDLSDWSYQGALLARHLRGWPDITHALKPYPVPNSTVTVLLGLLMLVVSWSAAVKCFVAFQLGLSFFAIHRLAQSAGSSPWAYAVAPGVLFLSLNLWFGFAAFQIGLALLLLFTAALLRYRTNTGSAWQLGVLLLLLFFTHMVPFTFACLLLVLMSLQDRRPGLLLQIAPSAVCLALYVVGRYRSGNPDAAAVLPATLRYASAEFVLYKGNTFFKSFGLVNPVDGAQHSLALHVFGRPLFVSLVLIEIAVACLAAAILAGNAMEGHRRRDTRFIWIAIAIVLPVYLLLPQAMLGISDPGSRVLQTAFGVALFFCPGGQRLWRAAGLGSAMLALAGVVLYAKLAGAPPVRSVRPTLPAPIELLAKAPYAYAFERYLDLDAGRMDAPVFPTGLFVNRLATTPAPRQ